jgi:hypothetical protein
MLTEAPLLNFCSDRVLFLDFIMQLELVLTLLFSLIDATLQTQPATQLPWLILKF